MRVQREKGQATGICEARATGPGIPAHGGQGLGGFEE